MSTPPTPGTMYPVTGPHTHAVYRSDDVWTVLARRHGEYTLLEVTGLTPVVDEPGTTVGAHWADIFDALAAAHGLDTTWAEELGAYQSAGAAMIAPLLGP
ncbi:hypothetical protein V6N00_12965 [Tersicoccus sp. MR15.9]|uniref:hypothetical protein n=1 Tax=Tersicoccus mangrovi TaxID=3121635 RepID=UPI002FE63A46